MYGMVINLMNFYIYSITYLKDDLEIEREEGIIAASSYADVMTEVDAWELDIEEVRLREVCGEYQNFDCEKPWISIEDLKGAFEEAGIQLFSKSAHRCSCEKKDNRPVVPDCVGDCVNDR